MGYYQSMIDKQKYIRKPLYVDAVRVTNDNFDEIVAWCQGEIEQDDVPGKGTSKQYIRVRVHNPKNPRQTKAFVGDWLLYTERGYKVYTNKAFHMSFDQVEDAEQDQRDVAQLDAPLSEDEEAAMTEDEARKSLGFQPLSPEMAQAVETIEAEGGTVEAATPQGIADAVEEETTEPPVADTRQVISEEDQQALDPDELRELLKSGEYVLAQDLAA